MILVGIDVGCIFVQEDGWYGGVFDSEWSADDADMEEDDWEELKNDETKRCVVLYPVN